jgi:hypothetical protein
LGPSREDAVVHQYSRHIVKVFGGTAKVMPGGRDDCYVLSDQMKASSLLSVMNRSTWGGDRGMTVEELRQAGFSTEDHFDASKVGSPAPPALPRG